MCRDEEHEPDIDVCTNCGAYFDWGGVARQRFIEDGNDWAKSSQRCYKCLTMDGE